MNVRNKAASLFDSLSWPSAEEESWRRTDLNRLLPKGILDTVAGEGKSIQKVFSNEGNGKSDLPTGYGGRVFTENGLPVGITLSDQAISANIQVEWVPSDKMDGGLESAGMEELSSSDKITAWHWRDMGGALCIRVPVNTVLKDPIVIEEKIHSPASSPHIDLEIGTGSQVNVIWSMEAGEQDFLPIINAALTARVGDNARGDITFRQNLGSRAVLFVHGRLELARDSRINFLESHLGGSLVKTRTRAVIRGEGSETRLKGVYVVNDKKHMDIGTLQEHHSPHAFSDALYKGAIHPGGRNVYAGLIEVAPDAVKTDAYLTNNNLLLGDGARTDSLPQLNIMTDDVKCSHGSTTGKLAEDQLFYLRSRGFSTEEAKRELSKGFLSEVLDSAPDAVRELLDHDLEAALLSNVQ